VVVVAVRVVVVVAGPAVGWVGVPKVGVGVLTVGVGVPRVRWVGVPKVEVWEVWGGRTVGWAVAAAVVRAAWVVVAAAATWVWAALVVVRVAWVVVEAGGVVLWAAEAAIRWRFSRSGYKRFRRC